MQQGESGTDCQPETPETDFSYFRKREDGDRCGKTEFHMDERDLAVKEKHSNKETPESRSDAF
ncbi:hypothetical protein [Escherichia coli]|uniref:hypothetical protein n=1 Tax=Escherichia coli TaxID=562 RepID=UPI000BE16F75|nr:hypothetical protein [Escherichia coli]